MYLKTFLNAVVSRFLLLRRLSMGLFLVWSASETAFGLPIGWTKDRWIEQTDAGKVRGAAAAAEGGIEIGLGGWWRGCGYVGSCRRRNVCCWEDKWRVQHKDARFVVYVLTHSGVV
ncbi:UNVERIFIED_CONTAM: hypothetical protein Sradi_4527100 [Sesamum radiatum]|uniref:Secreted protein n=1 Tax=Sesamum radiatum TaxID=300843 RepID=A0AAW2NAQ1_SESRA